MELAASAFFEVKDQCDQNDDYYVDFEHWPSYACFRMIPRMMLAMSSQRSIARSDQVVDFLPLHDQQRVFNSLERLGQGRVVVFVTDVFQVVDLDQLLVQAVRLANIASTLRPEP